MQAVSERFRAWIVALACAWAHLGACLVDTFGDGRQRVGEVKPRVGDCEPPERGGLALPIAQAQGLDAPSITS